jgi:hypothetical protein
LFELIKAELHPPSGVKLGGSGLGANGSIPREASLRSPWNCLGLLAIHRLSLLTYSANLKIAYMQVFVLHACDGVATGVRHRNWGFLQENVISYAALQ